MVSVAWRFIFKGQHKNWNSNKSFHIHRKQTVHCYLLHIDTEFHFTTSFFISRARIKKKKHFVRNSNQIKSGKSCIQLNFQQDSCDWIFRSFSTFRSNVFFFLFLFWFAIKSCKIFWICYYCSACTLIKCPWICSLQASTVGGLISNESW